METEIISTINPTDRDRKSKQIHSDDIEKDDSDVNLPEKDLEMKRPPSGQAPNPAEKTW